MHGFWLVEDLSELADGPSEFGARGEGWVCLFCLELQCDKISSAYRGIETELVTHS
jgi:hypothetical protein